MRGLASILMLMCCTGVAAQPTTAEPPTPARLDELYRDGDYAQVIRLANRLLAVKATPADQRHEVLRLKAESHLRLGSAEPAAKAFAEAAAFAPDEVSASRDRAMALLVRRSKRNNYLPASTAAGFAEPLPIDAADGRTLALQALLADERAAAAGRLASTPDSADLAALIGGLDLALHLRDLELAATGGDADAEAAIAPIADRALSLSATQLKTMTARVEKLARDAERRSKMGSHYRKRGLADDERIELRRIAAGCLQIADAAAKFEGAADSTQKKFTDMRRGAQELATRAEQVAGTDYGGLYDRK